MKPRAYVETNFLMEVVLDQTNASACAGIVQWAVASAIDLVLPASAIAEAAETIRRRRHDLRGIGKAASDSAQRTGLHRTAAFGEMNGLVEHHVAQVDVRRVSFFADVLKVASVIETSADHLREMLVWVDLNPPDALVLASIRAHLATNPPPAKTVFITSDEVLAAAAAPDFEKLGLQRPIDSLAGGHQCLANWVAAPAVGGS